MIGRQISQYAMGLKSIKVVDSNSKIWKADKVFCSIVDKIKATLAEIEDVSIRQKTAIKGITIEKNKYRDELNNSTNIIIGIICSHATNTDNPEIYQKFDIPKSSVKKMIDTRYPMLVKDITAYATTNKDVLKPFGLTDELLKKYIIQSDNYNLYLSKPAEAKAIIAEATGNLKKLMKNLMDAFITSLDKSMRIYCDSQPVFYGEYIEARYIYELPTHHFSLKGIVTDAETDEPLYFATVKVKKFKGGTELATKVKSTSQKGNYHFKGLESGYWTVIVENPFYETFTTEINILPNKMYSLDIKLNKVKKA